MRIKIGFANNARETVMEVGLTEQQLADLVAASCDSPMMLREEGGRALIIPPHALAYVEILPAVKKKVGFGVG